MLYLIIIEFENNWPTEKLQLVLVGVTIRHEHEKCFEFQFRLCKIIKNDSI